MSKIPTHHLFRFETFFQIFFLDSPTRQWGQEKRKRKKIVEHFSCFAVAFRWRKRRYIIVITCTRDQLRAPTPLSFSSSVRGKGRRQPKWRDVTQRSFFRDLKGGGRKLSKKKKWRKMAAVHSLLDELCNSFFFKFFWELFYANYPRVFVGVWMKITKKFKIID